MAMQKGMLMTAIVDLHGDIQAIHFRISKRAKEDGLFTEKENAYIQSVFTDILKKGSLYVEKVRELIAPKQVIAEEEKLKQLTQMYEVMSDYSGKLKKFEKAFYQLSAKRAGRMTDLEEVKRILKFPSEQAESTD